MKQYPVIKNLTNLVLVLTSSFLAFLAFSSVAKAQERQEVNEYLPYYTSAEFSPKWLTPLSAELNNLHKISDFKFINQSGDYVTQATFTDSIYVASFFFTACPGICPKMRSQLSKVQEQFSNNKHIKIISHSIQPKNDTVQVLKNYAQENGVDSSQWHLVTGDRDEIYSMARNSYFANEDLGEYVSNNDFLHTENLVLIDHNKHIRGIYNGLNNVSVNHLLNDITMLEKELISQLTK
ncbi:MAG: SCO family protein [Thalassotalea sp.]